MSDEQTIYISPEDDLTNVRERLEQITSRRVTLVIPAQTQLRSHVAWKLLHARARELGKDVLIISADPQIRSVAQAVKFKVAYSLESSSVGKTRPAPTRTGRTTKSGTPSRTLRGPTEGRNPRSRSLQAPGGTEAKRSRIRGDATGGLNGGGKENYRSSDKPFDQPYNFGINTTPPIRPLTRQQIDEEPDLFLEDFNQANDIRQAALRNDDGDRHISPMPAVPRETSPVKDLPQPYKMSPVPEITDDPFADLDDSLPPPSLKEQRGAVSIQGLDTGEHAVQDVSDQPTSVIDGEIEYQGDLGDFVIEGDRPPITKSHSWSEPTPEDEQDTAGPSRVYNVRRSRTGGRPGSTSQPKFDNDFPPPPPIEDRPTQVTPQIGPPPPLTSLPAARASMGQQLSPPSPVPGRQAGPGTTPKAPKSGGLVQQPPQRPRTGGLAASSGQKAPASGVLAPTPAPKVPTAERLVPQPPAMGTIGRTAPPPARSRAALPPPPARQVKPASGPARPPQPVAKDKKLAPPRRVGLGAIMTIVAALLLLFLFGLAYFGPTTVATVTLPTQDYTAPVKLTAQQNAQADYAAGVVPADLLSKEFTTSGTGKATGVAKVGKAPATGNVVFTNDGKTAINIPSRTVVATTNGVQFVTTAEGVASTPGGPVPNTIRIPIEAQKQGDIGNVPEGTITVLPDASLTSLAQYNNVPLNDLKVRVTNPQATTGGGVGSVPSVKAQDITDAQNALSNQLKGEINTWLNQQLFRGDIAGDPVTTSTLVNPPKEGDVLSSENFPIGLKLNVSVLVVRSGPLQSATVEQLRNALQKDKKYQNNAIISDQQNAVKVDNLKKARKDANTMTLDFTATGKRGPNITKEDVQRLIAGKSPTDARNALKKYNNVQSVDVQTTPGFFPTVAWWPPRVEVHFVSSTTPAKK